MKQYTFRELQTNTNWLDELPIEVIKYGKVAITLCDATELIKTKQMLADALNELEGGRSRQSVQSVDMVEKTGKKPSLAELRGLIASVENKEVATEKYVPRKCQFHNGCFDSSVAFSEDGQWVGDEWRSKPAHLCQKHIDFVAKDKESNV